MFKGNKRQRVVDILLATYLKGEALKFHHYVWCWCMFLCHIKDFLLITSGLNVVSTLSASVRMVMLFFAFIKVNYINRSFYFSKRFYLLIFREKGREAGREGEKHQCAVASHTPPAGDLVCNPGTCPDWELNQWPFGSQACAQSTEPHQPGLNGLF